MKATETFSILSGTTVIGSPRHCRCRELERPRQLCVLPAGDSATDKYTIQAVYNGTANFLGSTDTSQSLTITQAPTVTASDDTSATFSPGAQTVPLSATVSSGADPVDEGTETFTILSGMTAIGSAVTVNVGNRTASADYVLPAAASAGTYTIQAVYDGTATTSWVPPIRVILWIISLASTATASASTSATFSPASQTIPLSSTVSSGAGTVDEGTETFTILSGMTVIGAAVTVNYENGSPGANYNLPAATTSGTFTIQAVYNGSADFLGSTDTTHELTVNQATTATAASNISATFRPTKRFVPITATVSSGAGTVYEGTETFTILNGMNVIGSAVTVNALGTARPCAT